MPNIRRKTWRQARPPSAALGRPLPSSVSRRISRLHIRRLVHDGRLATRQDKPPFPERRHDQERDDGHEQQRDERVEAVVEDQPRRIGVGRPCERRGVRQEPEPRIGREHLLRSEEHTSELQSRPHLVCRLLLEKKKEKSTSSWSLA